MSFFEFYDIKPSFYVDEAALKQAYYQKMRELHPDMHVGADESKKAEILQLSSKNNDAYKTLRDFHKRLSYIIENYGEDVSKEMDKMFLMEMMDINEEVMELQMDHTEEAAKALKSKIFDQETMILNEIEASLKEHTAGEDFDQDVLTKAQDYLMKRSYLQRLATNCEKQEA